MNQEALEQTLASIQKDLAEMKAGLASLTAKVSTGSKGAKGAGGQSDDDVLLGALSSLEKGGAVSSLLPLLTGGKSTAIAWLLRLLLGGDEADTKIFDALGEMSPEMQKMAGKLRDIWPLIQLLSEALAGREAERASARRRPSQWVESMEAPRTQRVQEWGGWSVSPARYRI